MGLPIPATADDTLQTETLPEAQAALKQITRQVASAETASAQQLKRLKKEIARVRSSAQDCVEKAQPKIDTLDSQLAILQPTPTPDAQAKAATGAQITNQSQVPAPMSPAIARQVQDLQGRKSGLQERVATCKLMLLSTTDLASTVDDYLSSLQKRQLLTRGPNLVSVVQANLDKPEHWGQFTARLAETTAGLRAIHPVYLFGAGGIGLLGFSLGLILGHILPRRLQASMDSMKLEGEGVSGALLDSLVASIARYAPVVLALAVVIAYATFIHGTAGDLQLPVNIMYSLLAYFVIAAVIRALLNPCPPATHYLSLPTAVAISRPCPDRSVQVADAGILRGWFARRHNVHIDPRNYRHCLGPECYLGVLAVAPD